MMELEIKTKCEDRAIIQERLAGLGAVFREKVDQRDQYFSHPSRDFGKTDEALRLRMESGEWKMTYKGPKIDPDTKMREEVEFPIIDPVKMSLVLQRLGFSLFAEVVKTRWIYVLGNVEICLDHLKDLGDFVELEYSGEDLEKGKLELMDLKDSLGLTGNERRSYLELLLEKV